jgi:hypothetical protein
MVLPGEGRPTAFPARGRMTVANRRAYVLPLNLPLGGGDLLRYATAELLESSARGGRRALVFAGARDAEAEVELVTQARSARLDGKPVVARRVGRRLRLSFPTTGGSQTLVVR